MAALRVLLLLSILTAIFLAIGFFFAGIMGATIGLIIAFLTNFFAYWFSDKFVLRMYGAKKFSDRKIAGIVEKLAKKAAIPIPGLYVVKMDVPNAFATGRSPKHSAVAVTKGLVDNLDDDEIEGVLAHEINHIKHRDTLISTMAATISGALTWLGYMFWFSGDSERRNAISYILLFVMAPLAALLIRLAISRSREYFADRGGAEISSPKGLADALEKISQSAKERPVSGNHATSHMFIVNPFSGSFTSLFSTHPPVEERVRRLRAMVR